MKQKILFSGNCQVGVISQYFSRNRYLNELFEIIKVDESCYPLTAWRGDTTNFALWGHTEELQRQFCKGVHEKIKQADIFVFQSTFKSTIDELQTDYLCKNVSNGKNVCIPNMRVFVYCNDAVSLLPYIKYAKSKVKNPDDTEEIYNFLQTSDDPKLTDILEQEYPISTDYKKRRNENHQRAKQDALKKFPEDSDQQTNYICMENFIKENFKNKLLFFAHNHPTKEYFIEILRLLLINLGLSDFNIEEKDIQRLGTANINPMMFKFFREYFPLLKDKL
jgi:hypothetical protein